MPVACNGCERLRLALRLIHEKNEQLEAKLKRKEKDGRDTRDTLKGVRELLNATMDQHEAAQAELAAENARLAADLAARDAQLRVLQFALEQRVRATLHGPETCEISGPATLDYPVLEPASEPAPAPRTDEEFDLWSSAPPSSTGSPSNGGTNPCVAHPPTTVELASDADEYGDGISFDLFPSGSQSETPSGMPASSGTGPPPSALSSWSAIEAPSVSSMSQPSRGRRKRRSRRG